MTLLKGSLVYSPLRYHQKLGGLQTIDPNIQSFQAYYLYWVDTHHALSPRECSQLEHLLLAKYWVPKPTQSTSESYQSLYVFPRLGLCSPWSSKTMELLHTLGNLGGVKRIERGIVYHIKTQSEPSKLFSQPTFKKITDMLHDRMVQTVLTDLNQVTQLFVETPPRPLDMINVLEGGMDTLSQANQSLGLALSPIEMNYLLKKYIDLQRNPTDVELMMFAQINSEHCRHKLFNANWMIDGQPQSHTLFSMIRHTYKAYPEGTLSAYKDNGAVLQGYETQRWCVDPETKVYGALHEPAHLVIKVETHNHPTAVAPDPGAATGVGGEIRDEAAVGRGAKTKAGLMGLSLSDLHIPTLPQPWETSVGNPTGMASALDIILQAPIGSASFGNEFGRPTLCGYFRTLTVVFPVEERSVNPDEIMAWGYHKPIMIAGGLGNVRPICVQKKPLKAGDKILVLGGPAMRIGLGGGSASSVRAGDHHADIDFASVQRSNPQVQRRAQEVIDTCCAMGEANPIIAIHDVGAGGLSNAIPELLHGGGCGGRLDLRSIPCAESGLSPLEIWCNEAQERYVLAVSEASLTTFEAIAKRERCPYAVIGEATVLKQLILKDPLFDNQPANLSLDFLLGSLPIPMRKETRQHRNFKPFNLKHLNLLEAANRVLQLPAVADKTFLITINDRSVGGLVSRDPLVGRWQTPVSDVAVCATDFDSYVGEAMAMGERAPCSLLYASASVRLAVGEAITNIAAATIGRIQRVKLSANWMAASRHSGEAAKLYEAVQAVGQTFCSSLGLCIPVGKDSLSMQTVWQDSSTQKKHRVVSPISLVVSAFAPVKDIRKTVTPVLKTSMDAVDATELWFIDLAKGDTPLGGTALSQVYQCLGDDCADVQESLLLAHFFEAVQTLLAEDVLLAYHDRSDGGLFVTLCEMAFASRTGLSIRLDALGSDTLAQLFTEGLGAVIQIKTAQRERLRAVLEQHHLHDHTHLIGQLNKQDVIQFIRGDTVELAEKRIVWQQTWSSTSYALQALRDNPDCVVQAQAVALLDANDPGLHVHLTYAMDEDITVAYIHRKVRPRVAILREQGVNGHLEMAAAFHRAGFECLDIHMTDLLSKRVTLVNCVGLVLGGGFSYGDVLGAGRGWANSILHNTVLSDEFAAFFDRQDTFTLGACNGCQVLSHLTALIPGSEHWPTFIRNKSEQFESRFVMVEVGESPSILFEGMAGSRLPVIVAHGEGQAVFSGDASKLNTHRVVGLPSKTNAYSAESDAYVCLRYVDHYGQVTEHYPANPNGSPGGITGLTSLDGRVTIMMPHPERCFRAVQCPWHPHEWREDSPWLRLFRNARVWVG